MTFISDLFFTQNLPEKTNTISYNVKTLEDKSGVTYSFNLSGISPEDIEVLTSADYFLLKLTKKRPIKYTGPANGLPLDFTKLTAKYSYGELVVNIPYKKHTKVKIEVG